MTSPGTMRRHYRSLVAGCVFLLFVAACYMYLLPNGRKYLSQVDTPIDDTHTPLDFLLRVSRELSLDLSPSILYSRRCIEVVSSSEAKRQEVVSISEPLITDQVTLQGEQLRGGASLPQCTLLKLTTPEPHAVAEKFPDLIFGLATTYTRLRESLSSIEHWCSGRASKVIVMVEDYVVREAEVLELQQEYRDRDIQASFIAPIDESLSTSQNHFFVLTQMVKESGPQTKWFALLDDDTFFPHLKPLSDALGRLDHESDMYVGALSEDFGSVKNFGIMAYGGAGVYLSAHLARKLGALDQATECLGEAPENLGDIVLRNCVYHHSRAKLTFLPGLYQHDLLGDMSGFFESGVQPLNLHHWKSWYHEPVVKMAAAAKFCGDCFLQRWQFGTDTLLSNGYSIVVYPPGSLANIDLDRTEQTWNNIYGDVNPEYDFTIGPLRDRMGEGEKKSYTLVDTEISNHGVMKQLYIWKGNREAGGLDEVVELIWRR